MELDCEQGPEDGEVSPSPIETIVQNSPHSTLQQTRFSIEDIVANILSVKKEGKPKSVLGELVTQMFIHLVILRQVNRSILMEEDRVKTETERSKSPVDFTTLQLHNLIYEKNHYVKAIKTCKDFKSKYPYIELVPEEEFYRGASEEVTGALMSSDDSHNLTLKRLNYELFQRKELCKLHEKLEVQKKNLLVAIADRKKFLSSLPSHLKSLKKVSLPLQQQLGILHTRNLKQYHLAELLPPPLYVIYSQFSAQKEAFGEHIDIEIFGSVKDAQNFARQQALLKRDGMTGITYAVEISRCEDEAPDEDDDGQRRRKRTKRASGRESVDHSGIYQTHPLQINLHIYDDDARDSKFGKLVALKFEYLFKLNVVCAGIEGSQSNILCNLFPDDSGLDFPHQVSKLLAGHSKLFDENKDLRPYKWVQHLAGIDFLPEMAPLLYGSDESKTCTTGLSLYRHQNRIQTVVQRIRSRKKSQMALENQLEVLNKLRWPSLTNKEAPWALHTPSCTLHSWSPIVSDPRYPSPYVNNSGKAHDSLNSNVNEKSVSSKADVEYTREDGELPDFVQSCASDDVENPPLKMSSEEEHSRQMSLLSKSMVPSISKSFSFRKQDEENDILIDTDNEVGEFTQLEKEEGDDDIGCKEGDDTSWINCGVREFCFILTAVKDKAVHLKLEAKVKVSIEYPLRPPMFSLTLGVPIKENNTSNSSDFNWFNTLRSIEAEVNVHILEMIPKGEGEWVLAHQVRLLAMLFDLYVDDMLWSSSRGRGKSSSVVDIGLCKPVQGNLLSRYFRGRDRRKVLSWNNSHPTPGFPS